MNDHHFNVQVAIDFDPETSIFLNNMAFWLNIIIANRDYHNDHYYENKFWLFNSYTQWSEIFPYWSSKQMRRIIDNAINNSLILKGCFNKKKYDNTNWYTITDKALDYYPLLKAQVLNTPAQTGKTPAQTGKTPAQTGRPIPDSNPDSNPKCVGETPQHTEKSALTAKDKTQNSAYESESLKELFNIKFAGLNVSYDDLFKSCQQYYESKGQWITKDKWKAWIKREKLDNHSKIGAMTAKPPENETEDEKKDRQYITNELRKEKEDKGYTSRILQQYPEMREKYAMYIR